MQSTVHTGMISFRKTMLKNAFQIHIPERVHEVASYTGLKQIWSELHEMSVFQESFTCTRPEDAVACEESPQYYSLNEEFGRTDRPIEPSPSPADGETTLQ